MQEEEEQQEQQDGVEKTDKEREQEVEAKQKKRKNNQEKERREMEQYHLGRVGSLFKLPPGRKRPWTKQEALILGEIISLSIIEVADCLPNSFQASSSFSTAPLHSATVSSRSSPPPRTCKFVRTWTSLVYFTFQFRLALFSLVVIYPCTIDGYPHRFGPNSLNCETSPNVPDTK